MAITFDIDVDLRPFAPDIDAAKAAIMITDALAMASEVAPCTNDADFTKTAAAKAIIRGAILRWNDQGTGAATQLVAGPYQMTANSQPRRSMFFPSEIVDLQNLCTGDTNRQAFTVDTYPPADTSAEWDGSGVWPWVG